MHKETLQHIDNVAIWPIISFVIFFTFFLAVIWWTVSADKSFIDAMSNKPLEEETPQEPTPQEPI